MSQIGRYRLDRLLGSGSFATVWKAYDPDLDIPVAVKVLADNWSLHADVRERFLTEARLMRRIASDRVVRVHDVGLHGDQPYFVMDYVDGGSLADRIGGLEPAEAVRLTVEAAHAVQVLHDAGVVHRDVKPGNLLLDSSVPPRLLVADLGSAKLLADASGITVTTGTPAYMAPEQAGSVGGLDGRADVYALSVVGYELISGRRPYDGASLQALLAGGAADRPSPSPIAAAYGLPVAVDAVLAAGLQADPAARPGDANRLADLLTEATRPGPATGTTPGGDWPVAGVVGVALLLFVVSAALAWLLR